MCNEGENKSDCCSAMEELWWGLNGGRIVGGSMLGRGKISKWENSWKENG